MARNVLFLSFLLLIAPDSVVRASDAQRPHVPMAIIHRVQEGETLSLIAKMCGSTVDELQALNPGIGDRALCVGNVVRVPPCDRWVHHQVGRGDTLYAVSRHYAASIDEIRAASGLNHDRLELGDVLVIPRVREAIPTGPKGPKQSASVVSTQGLPAPTGASTHTSDAPWVEVRLTDGRRAWAPFSTMIVESPAAPPARVVEISLQFRGVPYRWGGQTPNGADCSGFVEEVFRLGGHRLPRMVDAQFHATQAVANDEIRPGDLVFFSTYEPGPSHVGIYLGDGLFVHASSSNGVTESRLDETYYSQRYLGARRLKEWINASTPDSPTISPSVKPYSQ